MRPGRIGESGRDVGRPRTDPHAQTEIVPDLKHFVIRRVAHKHDFETLCH